MKFRVIVEFDGKVASYGAYCPELPGCTSAGDTEEEALDNIKEAIVLYLEPSPLKIAPEGKEFEIEVSA